MMAKINFFATQVGQHANVISFIGAVTDNIHRKYLGILFANLNRAFQHLKQVFKMFKWVMRSHKSNHKQCNVQTTCTCYHTGYMYV